MKRLYRFLSNTYKKTLAYLSLKITLVSKGKHRIIAFDLLSLGELQFFQPVLEKFAERNPKDKIIIIHHEDTKDAIEQRLNKHKERLIHTRNEIIRWARFYEIDLYLTTEQHNLGLDGVYSIALFHGQPSKGLTFSTTMMNNFDALFLYGPLHRQAYDEFIKDQYGKNPNHIELFEIGYPKSDDLLNGCYSAKKILKKLKLNPNNKTILYAPAFNEGASLREYGLEIIKILATQDNFNVIVKLPIDCWQPTNNFYATGGINWFEKIHELQVGFSNLHIYSDYQIDPLLACSDVLITCISSVGFEFLALNKPVIFIDTPKYFSGYLKQRFPDKDVVSWADRTTVNGGKEFGLVVSDIQLLPQAIKQVLENPHKFPRKKRKIEKFLLYNRGKATEAAVEKIEELLACHVQSRREKTKPSLFGIVISSIRKKVIKKIKLIIEPSILRFLNSRGYTLRKTGEGYTDAKLIIEAARKAKLSICDYLESREADTRKHGRRNRIIAQMERRHVFESCNVILEIGTGTGMYLEKILDIASPKQYETYETDQGWLNYLRKTYSQDEGCNFIFHTADGETLKDTPSESCQLVHSHAVFVYTPVLITYSYLRESSRVLSKGGYLVFDCFLDKNFQTPDVVSWLNSQWRFPVIITEKLLLEFLREHGLELVGQFKELYGASTDDYLIFQKLKSQ